MKPGVERLDVTTQELEALLEGVREPLGEVGYQKLKAAIRTLAMSPSCWRIGKRPWRRCGGYYARQARKRPREC